MLINEYRKTHWNQTESFDTWLLENIESEGKPEFLGMVTAKINENPDNFEFQFALYIHYYISGQIKDLDRLNGN